MKGVPGAHTLVLPTGWDMYHCMLVLLHRNNTAHHSCLAFMKCLTCEYWRCLNSDSTRSCPTARDHHTVYETILQATICLCRHNRSFRFGIKFFLATAGAMAVIFPLSAHNQTVAANRQYFLLVALIASYQERADASIVRAVSRVTMSAIAASLGELPEAPVTHGLCILFSACLLVSIK